MEQAAELVVARDAALAGPDDVDRGQVDLVACGPLEVLEEAREVVQLDRTRVHAPEGVEDVGHRHLVEPRADVERADLLERALLEDAVVAD